MIARKYVAEGTCARTVLALVGVAESTFYYERPKQAHVDVGQQQRRLMPMVRCGLKNSL